MKLYYIRHGQSEANFLNIHSGWSQVPLTEQGRLDALRARRSIEGIRFDKVYSSDLARAIETQQIALPEANAERTALLREINVGNLVDRSFKDCYAEMGEEYVNNRHSFEFAAYGGESYNDLCSRVRKFLDEVADSGYESVAAFCHGGFINTTVDVITGCRIDRSLLACDNCSVSVFEFKNNRWSLKLWNYMGEL